MVGVDRSCCSAMSENPRMRAPQARNRKSIAIKLRISLFMMAVFGGLDVIVVDGFGRSFF